MQKIKISFNNKTYEINESAFSAATDSLKSHLSSVMNGSGTTINFGGTAYNIDSTKLTAATNDFISHLGTIAGSGSKVVIGGVEYSVDSSKIEDVISEFETMFEDFNVIPAGLYDVDGNLIANWETLVMTYGMNVEKKYASYNAYKTDTTTMQYILTNNNDLFAGVNLIIPDSVTSIGNYAFYNCSSLKNIKIPDNVTSIEDSAFSGCSSLENIKIPDGVTSISNGVFNNCSSLKNIKIPDNVTSIDLYGFKNCSSLKSIEIPDGVTSIGAYVFRGCSLLNNITFNGTIAEWNAISKVSTWNENIPATYVQCTDGTVAL